MLTIVESPLFSKLWPDAKSAQANIPAHVLKQIAQEMFDAPS